MKRLFVLLLAATVMASDAVGQTAVTPEPETAEADDAAKKLADRKAEEELRGLLLANDEKERALAEARRDDVEGAFPASDTTGKVDVKASAGLAEAQGLAALALREMGASVAAKIRAAADYSGSSAPERDAGLGPCAGRALPATARAAPPIPPRAAGGESGSTAATVPAPPAKEPPKPAPVLIISGDQTLSFAQFEQFRLRVCTLARDLEVATVAAAKELAGDTASGNRRPVGSAAGVGAALSVVSSLARLVTPDWEAGGFEVKASDRALARATAGAYVDGLPAASRSVYLRGTTSKLEGSDEVFASLRLLDAKEGEAKALAAALKSRIAAAQKAFDAIAKSPGAADSPQKAALDRLSGLMKALTDATAAYAQLLTQVDGKEGDVPLPINTVVEQAATALLLGQEGLVATVAVESAAGGYYTRRVLWNVFDLGGPPFFVTGGSVASYAVIRPSDQRVLAAGLLACHAGYTKISRVAAKVNGRGRVCTEGKPNR